MPAIISFKMLGLAGLASYATARLAARAGLWGYHRYALIAVPFARMPEMPRGFSVRALSFDELGAYEIDASRVIQQGRYDQGMTCLAAFNARDLLIGVIWLGLESFVEDEVQVRFTLPADAAWDTGLWIKPQFRLGRGFSALWAGAARWLASHQRTWSMSRIADYHLASLLSHRRMGAKMIGHATFIRFGRWQYGPDAVPRWSRLLKDAPPVLALASPDILETGAQPPAPMSLSGHS
jgi:hypothetical protein